MTEPRVLLVTKGLDLGGVERIVTDVAIGLRQHDVIVEVAVVNPGRDRLVPMLEHAGVAVHSLAGSDRIGIGAARQLARLVRSGDFDVVHVHGPLPAPIVRLAAGEVPVITTSHTPWTSLHPLTRLAWRATAGRDAATVAVSAAVAASLPPRAQSRALVLPHGVDMRLVGAALDRARSRCKDQPMVAIAVASHRDAKNYPNLLHAVRAALDSGAEMILVCVGEGPGLDAHRALSSSLGLEAAVAFEPPTEQILERICEADVLLVASDYEGQPIVVAEALALGKPVIATAVGRVPEMVHPAIGRVVPPRDPNALGAALAELANDRELLTELTDNVRRQPVQRTLDAVLDDHLALYRRVAHR